MFDQQAQVHELASDYADHISSASMCSAGATGWPIGWTSPPPVMHIPVSPAGVYRSLASGPRWVMDIYRCSHLKEKLA